MDRSCSKDDFLTCENRLLRRSCIGRELCLSASIESMEISKLTSIAVARNAELVVAPRIPYSVPSNEDEVPPPSGSSAKRIRVTWELTRTLKLGLEQ